MARFLILLLAFLTPVFGAIATENARQDYVGNGSVAAYGFAFPVQAATELRVFRQSDAAGSEAELVYNSDYTVSLGSDGTGTVTLSAGNLTNAYKLSIQRGIPYTQTYNPGTAPTYNAAALGRGLDRLQTEVARLKTDVARSIKIPYLEAGGDAVTKLTTAGTARANQAIIFDASGNPIVGGIATSSVVASAFMQTVLDDTTAANARVTLAASGVLVVNAKDSPYLATGDGTTNDRTALLAAQTAAGSGGIYLPAGVYRLSASTTFTKPVTFAPGASLSVDSTFTATLDGEVISNYQQIFAGLGTCTGLMKGSQLNVMWWGAIPDGGYVAGTGTNNSPAFNAAIACANNHSSSTGGGYRSVIVPPGSFGLGTRIDIPSGVKLVGLGPYNSNVFNLSTWSDTTAILRTVEGGFGQPPGGVFDLGILANIYIAAAANGVRMSANGSECSRCWFGGFIAGALKMASTNQMSDGCVFDNGQGAASVGCEITAVDTQLTRCTIYQQNLGIFVHDLTTASGYGAVKITDVVIINPVVNGYGILCRTTGGLRIQISGVTMNSDLATGYEAGGIKLEDAPSVHVHDCMVQTASASAGAIGYWVTGTSNDTTFSECSTKNLLVGTSISASDVRISGGTHTSASLYGVNLNAFSRIVVDGVVAKSCGTGFNVVDGTGDCVIGTSAAMSCTVGFAVVQNAATYNTLKNCHSVSTTDYSITGTPGRLIQTGNSKQIGAQQLSGSVAYDPPSLVDGAGTTTTVTVTGAALGDFAAGSFALDLQGITVNAYVSAANTVSFRFQNETGGTLDLASATLRAYIIKP